MGSPDTLLKDMIPDEVIPRKFDGAVFSRPDDSSVFTRVFPGGGLTPSGLWVPFAVTEAGEIKVSLTEPSGSTATLSRVTAATSSKQVLAANPDRHGFICYNNSTAVCYLAFADTATNTLFTEQLEPGSTYSMDLPVYTGVISAVWESSNGALQVTEW